MKNLSAIPRLFLFAAFTILITLAVCLAGFTGAEVRTDFRKGNQNRQGREKYIWKKQPLKENIPMLQKVSKMRGDELSQKSNFANYIRNFPKENNFQKIIKRHSDDFDESEEFDNEKENDGYGYDDDEYYHFNYKRNENSDGNSASGKAQVVDGAKEFNKKDESIRKFGAGKNLKDNQNQKETGTVEMISFKNSQPVITNNPIQSQNSISKATLENSNKKASFSKPADALKMSDLKENSAIDDKIKDKKEETSNVVSSSSTDQKTADAKSSAKASESKDSLKLKDLKVTNNNDKKENQASNLKDGKEVVSSKNVKEPVKNVDEKNKIDQDVKISKLSGSEKLEENVEKLNKKGETVKIAKKDKDSSKFIDKTNAEVTNPTAISQINSRASFVSNDFKENINALKVTGDKEGNKNQVEQDEDKQTRVRELNDYVDEVRKRHENLREDARDRSNEYSNSAEDNQIELAGAMGKMNNYYNFPAGFEVKYNPGEYYRKRESWKEPEKAQFEQQLPPQMTYDPQIKGLYRLNFPLGELENTDYHRNYIKSLRRYKGLDETPKVLNPEHATFNSGEKKNCEKTEGRKKKRSKLKKRRSMGYDQASEKNEKNRKAHLNLRRSIYEDANVFSRESQSYMMQPFDAQSSRITRENLKPDPNLHVVEKYGKLEESNRQIRKSSPKLEYEIKIINQNHQNNKDDKLINPWQNRRKKNIITKLADHDEDKYLKKYPYSQVSLDDLTKFSQLMIEEDKKFKRKAPFLQEAEQFNSEPQKSKSHVKIRGVPLGYYSNRVKFGQKHLTQNEEKQTRENTGFDKGAPLAYVNSRPVPTYEQNNYPASYKDTKLPVSNEKTFFQLSWDSRSQNNKHQSKKRQDNSVSLTKNNVANSLLLVKKEKSGDRIAKEFDDTNTRGPSEDELNSEQLAKMLSRDNNYVVLKRTAKNKFQKMSDQDKKHLDYDGLPSSKKSDIFRLSNDENLQDKGKQISPKNRGMHTRSYHTEEDKQKKMTLKFHNSEMKSSFRKTFDKFRDLADFFRDTEQESPENQHLTQELKQGSNIVFSEDKLPDPIVINNEVSGKNGNSREKSQNSVSSISTNFKQLDQEGKSEASKENESGRNMFISEVKADNVDGSSWEPALKNAFPEAKSINTIQQGGSKIIVVDFYSNRLKADRGSQVNPPIPKQLLGSLGWLAGAPNSQNPPSDRQIELALNDGSITNPSPSNAIKPFYLNKEVHQDYPLISGQDGTLILSSDKSPQQIAIPLSQLAQLPKILRNPLEKKPVSDHYAIITKKNVNSPQTNTMSTNVNKFLRDLRELSEINNEVKRGKLTEKRKVNQLILPSSSFPELSSYTNANVKHLGNILQNIMSTNSVGIKGNKELPYEESKHEVFKDMNKEYQKSIGLYSNTAGYKTDPVLKRQGQWTSTEEKRKETPFREQMVEHIPEEVREAMTSLLQSEGMKTSNEKDFQNELREELSAASNKIQRLRREGMGKKNLRKTIEEALSFRERRESGKNVKSDSKIKMNDDKKIAESKSKINEKSDNSAVVVSEKKEGNDLLSKTQLNGEQKNKEDSVHEKVQVKSELNKDLKFELSNSNENKVNSRKRRCIHKQKYSSRPNIKNKVSRTEVENRILNLAEDNCQSVYSSGIKRKLLSIEDEADADGYFNAGQREDTKLNNESEPKSETTRANKCIDPMLVEVFGGKIRARRSLAIPFHSNYKREIDLDESMPNDFQNFLVTSLGGYGSQKREVVKKDEAYWEEKENSQDNSNQIVEYSVNGKDTSEDSPLEKREVSSGENHKRQSYKSSNYYEDRSESGNPNQSNNENSLHRPKKKIKLQDKTAVKPKRPEFEEEKVPTQIRIQITNASSKEKKSSKPIMDESENGSNEIEAMPKEKDVFEKNKLNSQRISNPHSQKLHQIPKSKYSYTLGFGERENSDNAGRQKLYVVTRPCRRGRKKKKKYVEENPMKPVKDFMSFDQKAMESLIRKYLADQNLYSATTQKMPVSNRLPQVETVYNPTQGTNKAQIQDYEPNKVNSLGNKNTVSAENNLHSSDASTLNEGVLRSYLEENPVKLKAVKYGKQFESSDWKPFSDKMKSRQDSSGEISASINLRNYKNHKSDAIYSNFNSVNSPVTRFLNPYNQVKRYQTPYTNYFYRDPSTNSINTNYLYDDTKKNWNGLTKESINTWTKPEHYIDTGLYKQDDKDGIPAAYTSQIGDSSWNTYDYLLNKKPFTQKLKYSDYGSGIKNEVDTRNKIEFTPRKFDYLKNTYDDKQSILGKSPMMDTTNDVDYLDSIEDEYIDDDISKQDPQFDDSIETNLIKKSSKDFDTLGYHNYYKNTDTDDALTSGDNVSDEDYNENSEDDDLDDYSFLATTNNAEPEMTKFTHGSLKFQDSNSFNSKPNQFELKGNTFEHAEFKNSKINDQFDSRNQQITLTDVTSNMDPLAGSMNVLKKANENSNIFGKNLMKNLNRYNYGETWKNLAQKDNDYGDVWDQGRSIKFNDKMNEKRTDWQPKLKRSHEFHHEFPLIGSRFFYAARTNMYEPKNVQPNAHIQQRRKSRNVYYRVPKRNPLNAELRGAENEFEYESEENGKHFNGNIINNGKDNSLENEEIWEEFGSAEEERGTNKRDSSTDENSDDVEGEKENLEGDGENIAEDNVLENVIGKYIVRKSVKIPSESKIKKMDVTENISTLEHKDSTEHKNKKRSVNDQLYSEKDSSGKILRKRLSSGHLTETNYRKYKKKNFHKKKRHTKELNNILGGSKESEWNEIGEEKFSNNKVKANEEKRSALDLFKKITNKDKDKKVEHADSRAAGFEPLLSFSNKNYGNYKKEIEEFTFPHVNQLPRNNERTDRPKSLVTHVEVNADEKEKSKEKMKKYESPKVDGPWKIELNEKYDGGIAELIPEENKHGFQGGSNGVDIPASFAPDDESQNLKAYLVISKKVRSAKQTPIEEEVITAGTSEREVGNSYRSKSDKGAEKHAWKRSSKPSVNWVNINEEDSSDTEGTNDHLIKVPIKESHLNLQEKNRALHDTKSFLVRDSVPAALHSVQRNPENTNFVRTEAGYQNAGEKFFSKEILKNKKSVFPPTSDANIIGDSRHLSEETSKYLGQQIVDSILAQVSSNPRFKKLIAPGLANRMPYYYGNVNDNKKPSQHTDFSEQVQSLLHKVMSDIEKIAEGHVKRRMCNKIDKQSKQFLQSLLNLPADNSKDANNFYTNGNICTSCEICPKPTTQPTENVLSSPVLPLPITFGATNDLPTFGQESLDNLKKKQMLLVKIINDYRHLSELEKQSIDVNFRYLLKELEQTNQALQYKSQGSPLPPVSIYSYMTSSNNENEANPQGFESASGVYLKGTTREQPEKNVKTTPPFENSQAPEMKESTTSKALMKSTVTEETTEFSLPETTKSKDECMIIATPKTTTQSPTSPFNFNCSDDKIFQSSYPTSTTPETALYEKISQVNCADIYRKKEVKSLNTKKRNLTETELGAVKFETGVPTPETFDLLPGQNVSKELTANLPTQKLAESVRIKQSLSNDVEFGRPKTENPLCLGSSDCSHRLSSGYKLSELHRLGIGDAAGLQLSLKYNGPFVSNLEVAKNLPKVVKGDTLVASVAPKQLMDSRVFENQLHDNFFENSFMGDLQTSKSLIVPNNKYKFAKPLYRRTHLGALNYCHQPVAFQKFHVQKNRLFSEVERKNYGKYPEFPGPYLFRKHSNLHFNKNLASIGKRPGRRRRKRSRSFKSRYQKSPTANFEKSQSTNNENEDDNQGEDPGLEYLIWSSMPVVRRRLNNLEMGIEFDEVPLHSQRKKIYRRNVKNAF